MRQAYIDDSAFTKFSRRAEIDKNKSSQSETVLDFGSALTKDFLSIGRRRYRVKGCD